MVFKKMKKAFHLSFILFFYLIAYNRADLLPDDNRNARVISSALLAFGGWGWDWSIGLRYPVYEKSGKLRDQKANLLNFIKSSIPVKSIEITS